MGAATVGRHCTVRKTRTLMEMSSNPLHFWGPATRYAAHFSNTVLLRIYLGCERALCGFRDNRCRSVVVYDDAGGLIGRTAAVRPRSEDGTALRRRM